MPVTFNLYDAPDLAEAAALQRRLADNPKADHGLRFTKFFGRWSRADRARLLETIDERTRTEPVLDWLNPKVEPGRRRKSARELHRVGDEARLAEAGERIRHLAAARRGDEFSLKLASRLLTGTGLPHPTENGFLFHPTLGVPYLRGTALKQVARGWAMENVTDAEVEVEQSPHFATIAQKVSFLFGHVDKSGEPVSSGALAFLDAIPLSSVTLTAEQITSHYPGYYADATDPARGASADWHEPNPVTLLAVEAPRDPPLRFQLAVVPLRAASPDNLTDAVSWLTRGLMISGIGAKTTLGYGRFGS